jgi:oligoendopeptidase F
VKIKLLFTLIVLFFSIGSTMAEQQTLDRDEIDAKYKWNFEDIFSSWDAWQQGMTRLDSMMQEMVEFRGSLSQGPQKLLAALQLSDDLEILAYRVYRYPQLMRDTDTRNQEIAAKLQQVQILFAKFNTATSWMNPEILQIPWPTVEQWIEQTPALKPYSFPLSDLFRQQKHVLDEEKEKLLSYFSQFNGAPRSIYTELATSDIDFPKVELSTGDSVTMTAGNYQHILATHRNQNDRKKAYEAHYQVYADNINTYAAIYNGVCQRDWASAQARNYASTLEAALDDNNIPTAVYTNLIETVKAHTQPLQRYMKLRKRVLGLETYHTYDGSIPLTDFDKSYPYEEAKNWMVESVLPLGQEYQNKLKTALSAGWLDVFENTGKRPGAYSANVYGVHPYMLLNYKETLDNVFTLAHELGHTIHTVLSNENQPFATHDYTIFVAEVASTFNERLLLDYLMEKTTDPKERISLLQQSIRGITGTFYFQVLLADFEYQAHKLAEEGKPITADVLNGIMHNLFEAYYGTAFVHDEFIDKVWSRISHFYYAPFYVYQYATCFASSAQIYKTIQSGSKANRKNAIDRYLELLKSGGNDYPMQQLLRAGVDLTETEPVMAVIDQLDQLITRLETEIERL